MNNAWAVSASCGVQFAVAEPNLATYLTLGIAVNLLTGTMDLGKAESANFMDTSIMLLCVLVGLVADSFLGRYLTIAIFVHGKRRKPAVAGGTSSKPPTSKRASILIRQDGRRRRDLAVASQIIMASMAACRSLALVLVVVVAVSVTGAAAGSSKSLEITNNCNHTVWPGISSGAGSPALETTGFELPPGQSHYIRLPLRWSGRVWGRTLCSTESSGSFTCGTGDCGSGSQECAGGNAAPPVTLAQFTLDEIDGDSFDVSLVNGYNLPMVVAPKGAASGANCAPTGCVAPVNVACPAELRVTSAATGVVACKSACQALGLPQYCCTGEYGTPDTCKPLAYSQFFKKACPRAYSYAYDGAVSSTCAGDDTGTYSIIFCPNTPSGMTFTIPRSEPPGNGNLTLINGGGSTTKNTGGGDGTTPNTGGGGGSTTPNTSGGGCTTPNTGGRDGTTPNTGGGDGSTTPNTSGGNQPWRIALVVTVLGVVTAALGALAKFLGLFKPCCNSPIQGAGGAAGQHYPSASIQINPMYIL